MWTCASRCTLRRCSRSSRRAPSRASRRSKGRCTGAASGSRTGRVCWRSSSPAALPRGGSSGGIRETAARRPCCAGRCSTPRPTRRPCATLGADPLLREAVAGAPGRRVPGCVDPARSPFAPCSASRSASPPPARRRRGSPSAAASGCPSPPAASPTCSRPPARSPRSTRRRCRCRAPAAARSSRWPPRCADGLDPRDRAAFLALRGIGPWTADYVAMRCGDRDVLLETDLGVRRGFARLADPATLTARGPSPGGPGAPTPSSTCGASHDRLRHRRQPDRRRSCSPPRRRADPPLHGAVRGRPGLAPRPRGARRARAPARGVLRRRAHGVRARAGAAGTDFQRARVGPAARDPLRRDDHLRGARAASSEPAQRPCRRRSPTAATRSRSSSRATA